MIELKMKSQKVNSLTLMGTSDNPNVTNDQLMEGWKEAFIKAISGDRAKAVQEAQAVKRGKNKKSKPRAIQADELSDDESTAPAKPKKTVAKKAAADDDDEDAGGFGNAD